MNHTTPSVDSQGNTDPRRLRDMCLERFGRQVDAQMGVLVHKLEKKKIDPRAYEADANTMFGNALGYAAGGMAGSLLLTLALTRRSSRLLRFSVGISTGTFGWFSGQLCGTLQGVTNVLTSDRPKTILDPALCVPIRELAPCINIPDCQDLLCKNVLGGHMMHWITLCRHRESMYGIQDDSPNQDQEGQFYQGFGGGGNSESDSDSGFSSGFETPPPFK